MVRVHYDCPKAKKCVKDMTTVVKQKCLGNTMTVGKQNCSKDTAAAGKLEMCR